MNKRVEFCGAIGGSVEVREGETPVDAVRRAQDQLLTLFERTALSLGHRRGIGPNVGLEVSTIYEEPQYITDY